MSFFENMAKGVLDKLSGEGAANPLLETVMGLVSNPETGGLSGMLENFKSKGLGDIIASWIGTGENQPISSDQILNVIGKDQISNLAEKVGFSPEETMNKLADFLPQFIDKMTPEGKLPETGFLDQARKFFS